MTPTAVTAEVGVRDGVCVTRWWLLVGGVLVTAGLGWWVLQVTLMEPTERSTAAGYGQFVLTAAGLLVSAVALRRTFPTTAEPGVDELADLLAVAMRNQWTAAANDRRLLQPAPLPIRWCRATSPVAGPITAATDHALFDPLPGLDRVTSDQLRRGTRRNLHRVYGGLASGRLVIVGGPGIGKSSVAILLLLDALRYRDHATPTDRQHIPAPVLFTLQDWDPATTPVEDWLANKLTEVPLFRGRNGTQRAKALLGAGRIAVFLDGLDEIAEPMRPVALQALSEHATFRLVLLTRTTELATAAQHHILVGAAALELQPLTPTDAADYLLRPLPEPPPAAWRNLTATLTKDPTSPLARTLTTPLTVSLLRDIYSPTAPVDELTNTTRFPTPETITNHLLDHAITAAYTPRPGQPKPRYTPRTVHRTLTFIAHHLTNNHTRDLTWWTITERRSGGLAIGLEGGVRNWLRYSTTPLRFAAIKWRQLLVLRGLVRELAVGLTAGLIIGLIRGGLAAGLVFGLGVGLLYGLMGWLMYNLTAEVRDTDSASPVKVWRGDLAAGLTVGLTLGFALVFMVGLTVGLTLGFATVLTAVPTLAPTFAFAVMVGLLISKVWLAAAGQIYLTIRYRTPLRLIRFLEDARSRHLLRTVGPVYQFRHATLQDRLAGKWGVVE